MNEPKGALPNGTAHEIGLSGFLKMSGYHGPTVEVLLDHRANFGSLREFRPSNPTSEMTRSLNRGQALRIVGYPEVSAILNRFKIAMSLVEIVGGEM